MTQQERFKSDGIFANAHMKPKHLRKYCKIDADCQALMEAAMNRLGLSARAHYRRHRRQWEDRVRAHLRGDSV